MLGPHNGCGYTAPGEASLLAETGVRIRRRLGGAQRRPACGWESAAVGADRTPTPSYTLFFLSSILAGASVRANVQHQLRGETARALP